jgi:hypothetical protein
MLCNTDSVLHRPYSSSGNFIIPRTLTKATKGEVGHSDTFLRRKLSDTFLVQPVRVAKISDAFSQSPPAPIDIFYNISSSFCVGTPRPQCLKLILEDILLILNLKSYDGGNEMQNKEGTEILSFARSETGK